MIKPTHLPVAKVLDLFRYTLPLAIFVMLLQVAAACRADQAALAEAIKHWQNRRSSVQPWQAKLTGRATIFAGWTDTDELGTGDTDPPLPVPSQDRTGAVEYDLAVDLPQQTFRSRAIRPIMQAFLQDVTFGEEIFAISPQSFYRAFPIAYKQEYVARPERRQLEFVKRQVTYRCQRPVEDADIFIHRQLLPLFFQCGLTTCFPQTMCADYTSHTINTENTTVIAETREGELLLKHKWGPGTHAELRVSQTKQFRLEHLINYLNGKVYSEYRIEYARESDNIPLRWTSSFYPWGEGYKIELMETWELQVASWKEGISDAAMPPYDLKSNTREGDMVSILECQGTPERQYIVHNGEEHTPASLRKLAAANDNPSRWWWIFGALCTLLSLLAIAALQRSGSQPQKGNHVP